MSNLENDPMLDLFIFETLELISQLENIVLAGEKENAIKSQISHK